MEHWKSLLETKTISKESIESLIVELKESDEEFLQNQGEKIEHYLTQYANQIISKEEFDSYIEDIKDLTHMELLRKEVKELVLYQRAIAVLTELLMKGALSLVKSVI